MHGLRNDGFRIVLELLRCAPRQPWFRREGNGRVHGCGQASHGGRLEDERERQIDRETGPHALQHLYRQQGMSAQSEKVLLNANLHASQQDTPDLRDRPFSWIRRCRGGVGERRDAHGADGGPVNLAGGSQRHALQQDVRRRRQRSGKHLSHVSRHSGGVRSGLAGDERNQTSVPSPVHANFSHGLADRRHRAKSSFYVSQINPYAVDFDLRVQPAENFDFTILQITSLISGAVQADMSPRMQHEAAFSLRFIAPIAFGQARARDEQLPRDARGAMIEHGVHDEHFLPSQGAPVPAKPL